MQCLDLWSFSCDPIFSPHQFSEAYRILCSPQCYNNDSQTLNLQDSHDWTKEYCGHFCLLCLCYMTLQLAAMTWNKSSNLVMQTWCGFDVDIRVGNAPSGSIHIILISSTTRVWIFLLHILETNKSTFTADLSHESNHVVESLQNMIIQHDHNDFLHIIKHWFVHLCGAQLWVLWQWRLQVRWIWKLHLLIYILKRKKKSLF